MTRAAAWTSREYPGQLPLVIAIDDTGYEKFFDSKSPVARERVLTLLRTISEHTRPTTRVLIDLDVSPVPGQARAQAELEKFLLRDPGRWVLPAVRSGSREIETELAKWRTTLCASGIDFGLPYIHNEFGYPALMHQYRNSLADAGAQRGVCADPALPMTQKAMPLQATYLKTGLIFPFSGDLDVLAGMLDAVNPASVVLGGAWGQSDIFATPFGDRFGVQIHAAALAGIPAGEHVAPASVELLLSWTFVSLISTVLFYLSQFLSRHTDATPHFMVGHAFFSLRVRPILMAVTLCAALMGLVELLAVLHAVTGLWVNTAKLVAYMAVWFVIPWNLGRTTPTAFKDWRAAFRGQIVSPLRMDVLSIFQATQVIFRPSRLWMDGDAALAVSRPRAMFEGCCALVSLLMQSAVPLASVLYILYKIL
jgi:hypothetical protein